MAIADSLKYTIEVRKLCSGVWEWQVIYHGAGGRYTYPVTTGFRFSEKKAWEVAKKKLAKRDLTYKI